MDLRFSRHALKRMQLRSISRDDVEAVLAGADDVSIGRTAVEYAKVIGDRRIGVVVARRSSPPLVITVMVIGEEYSK